MDRTISKVKFEPRRQINVLRVAAYARVSTGKDSMLHSLSAQVSYYSDLIQKHPARSLLGSIIQILLCRRTA